MSIEWRKIQQQSNEIIDEIYKNDEVNKGVFNINPAAGKSWIELYTAYKYDTSILFEPTKRLVKQFMDEEKKEIEKQFPYINEMNLIQINSDVNADIKKLKNNKKNLIIANIQSAHKVKEYIQKYNIKVNFVIYDEAHKYTTDKKIKRTIDDDDDEINFDLVRDDIVCFNNYKQLFFSGTITKTIFENEDIFGKEMIKYTYYDCLTSGEKIVCPFEVIVSHINEINKPMTEEKIYEILIGDLCKYIKQYNKQKTLIFTSYANDCKTKNFRTSIKKFKEYVNKFDKELKIFYFESKMSSKKTDKELESFKQCKEQAILISCKKISEGIDIQKCDMVALLDPSKSIPTNLQRLSRSTRYDRQNPNKVAHVYVPIFIEGGSDVNDEVKRNQYELAIVVSEIIKTDLDMKPLFNIISKNNKQSGLFERSQMTRDEFNEQTEESEIENDEEQESEQEEQQENEQEQEQEEEETKSESETENEIESEEEQQSETESESETETEEEEQIPNDKLCKINVYINVDIDEIYDIQYYVDEFQRLTAEIVPIDWRKCLEEFVEKNGNIKPKQICNEFKYNGKNEKAIRNWINRSEFTEDGEFIESLIPDAYEEKREKQELLTLEEKIKSLKQFCEKNPGKLPKYLTKKYKNCNKKYFKMTEKQLYKWIRRAKDKQEILKILPNAYEEKRKKFTLEEKIKSLKQFCEENPSKKPKILTKEHKDFNEKYFKMTETQLHSWIKLANDNDKQEILKILPDAYEEKKQKREKLTLEQKIKSLKQFCEENPGKKPISLKKKHKDYRKKYFKMTECELRDWIRRANDNDKQEILKILPNAYNAK